jgi:glycosyltransferase involved in cell wall biosynthesis
MPRLLILCEYPTLLGGERSMLATLPTVAAGGFDVVVAAPPDGPLATALVERGICHFDWPTHDAAGERFPLDRLRADLAGVVHSTQPDLLHANSLSTSRISGPVAVECGVRSIGHLRDILNLSSQAIEDLNQHQRLVAVSQATRDFHIKQGLDEAKCAVLYNGVDLDEFQPRPPSGYLHRELGLPSSTRLIAVIGQLGLRKGTDVALSAALQIAESERDVHWLIVGERTSNKTESHNFEASLQSIAAEKPLAGRVHFLGSRNDMAHLLCECTLLVHAARQEPLGRVLLEAAACGLAIVATDVGGTREIFPANSGAACLVRPNSHLNLADTVLGLLRDDARRRALGAAARRRAESDFDIRIAAKRVTDLYRELLNSPKR